MSDDRQVRGALKLLLDGEDIRYFELASVTLEPKKAFWSWILLGRQCVFFRDFEEKGNAWYQGATPAMTDRCFGKPCQQLKFVKYAHIVKVVRDANTSEHFMIALQGEAFATIYVRSTNREPLLKHLRLCWQVDTMYGNKSENREGRVAVLEEMEMKITRKPKVLQEVQPFWQNRWESFQGYKFMVPYEFGSAPQAVQAGHAVRFVPSDACHEHDASITIHVHNRLTFERLKALKRDHIRWVAAGYKQHLIEHADNYHISTYKPRQKRMNLTGDCSSWHMWEIHLATKSETVVCIVCRRQYLPPLCNTAQDIGIILRCPANDNANSTMLVHRAHLLADSLCPEAAGFQVYTDIVQAKLDALRYDEGGMEWIEAQLKEGPSHKKPDEEIKVGAWVKTISNIDRVFEILTKSWPYRDEPQVPKGRYGRAVRFNPELRTWRIAWYMKDDNDRNQSLHRVETRILKKNLALIEVVDPETDSELAKIKEWADMKGHNDKDAMSAAPVSKQDASGPAKIVPTMDTCAKALVYRLLKLYCESQTAERLVSEHAAQYAVEPGKADTQVRDLFTKQGRQQEDDAFMQQQLAGLFMMMRKVTTAEKDLEKAAKHVLKASKANKGDADPGMVEFLNIFTSGGTLQNALQIQTGLEKFNTDAEYQWDVNSDRHEGKCLCCGELDAQSCRIERGGTDLAWCVSSHWDSDHVAWHCYKYCFRCWRVRSEWTKRVASYFAWAVDGGLLGSRFPIPEDGRGKDEPVRYGSLLDVMLEPDVWRTLESPDHQDAWRKSEVHVALYFMLHMRQVDAQRAYDGELHMIGLGKPDDDCNGLYKFCGLSKGSHGDPWFQKTTKRDTFIYLYDGAAEGAHGTGGRSVVQWKNQLPQPPRKWWVLIKGRVDSPWEPHEEEQLVAFAEMRPPPKSGTTLQLAWPPHGHDRHNHWRWNRLVVTDHEQGGKEQGRDVKNLTGVYEMSKTPDGHTCWQHTTKPRSGSIPRLKEQKEPDGKKSDWLFLSGTRRFKDPNRKMLKKHFDLTAQCQPSRRMVFMYSDGEIQLLYQQVQYVIMKNWEFNDRVMMMLLSKQYFSKQYWKEPGEDTLKDDKASSDDKLASQGKSSKADLADRVRCLGKLLDSNASLDLQAFVCKTLMGMFDPVNLQDLDEDIEDLCILALDSLVKLTRTNNLFITTYATAALVNLSKDRSLVKGTLLGLHIAEICMKNLDTRDEDLMFYTLMLVAHLTKDSSHRNVMIDSGLVPKLYDMLIAAYGGFKPSRSNSSKVSVQGFNGKFVDQFNGSYTRMVRMDAEQDWNCESKFYRSDNQMSATDGQTRQADPYMYIYCYPKKKQKFFIITKDPDESQYNDEQTVQLYLLVSEDQKLDELPQRERWTSPNGKWFATVTISRAESTHQSKTKAIELKAELEKTKSKGDKEYDKFSKGMEAIQQNYELQKKDGVTMYTEARAAKSVKESGGDDKWYIKEIDGYQWWCIGKKPPSLDPKGQMTPYVISDDVVAHNLVDRPEESEYPPFDAWDMNPKYKIHPDYQLADGTSDSTPRVSTHVLPSKEKLLVQLCIVIGQLANEEHYRKLFLYDRIAKEDGSTSPRKKYTMDCLVFMFHQVIGLGDDLPEEEFTKAKHQAPLSKVIFAIKQLCANDIEQKKIVGAVVIKPLVKCLYHWHPVKDRLLKEFIFQSFILIQMLASVWENLQILVGVRPSLAQESDTTKHAPGDGPPMLMVDVLNRIKEVTMSTNSAVQEGWVAKVDTMKTELGAVALRLKK